MRKYNRIFIVGHPGAGKALLAKILAEKIGWKFIDADLGLESKFGRPLITILGNEGLKNLSKCQEEVLETQLSNQKIVVATDGNIAGSEKSKELLSSEFVVFLKTNTKTQLERNIRNQEPLLPLDSLQNLFQQLHQERDDLYESISDLIIDGNNSALDEHIAVIMKTILSEEEKSVKNNALVLEKSDVTQFHKTKHIPVKLSPQQATCLKLLASGQSSKIIARTMNISYRTVEGYIAELIAQLGCDSSKDLIILFHKKS